MSKFQDAQTFWEYRVSWNVDISALSHIPSDSENLQESLCEEKKLSVTHTFSLGCSSVIEYSRSLIWPRSIFFILSVWCWFSYGMLINSNNVWIWGIIQICKIFARLWQFSFFALGVLQFFTNDEKSWVRINYAVILQSVKILFFSRSLRFLKICMVNP